MIQGYCTSRIRDEPALKAVLNFTNVLLIKKMCIYHALINALSAHMIHINLNIVSFLL